MGINTAALSKLALSGKFSFSQVDLGGDYSLSHSYATPVVTFDTMHANAFVGGQTDSIFGGFLHEESGSSTPVKSLPPITSLGDTGVFQNQDINGILYGVAWDTDTITYSFPTKKANYGGADYSDQDALGGFEKLDAAHQQVVRYALSLISQYTGLTFQEITETNTTHATLRFAGSSYPSTSYAWIPGNYDAGGDVWYGNIRDTDPVKAGYEFDTILHEIGHAMGLKHGQEDDATYGTLPADHNSTEWSVMDYYSYVGSTDLAYLNADGSGNQTYMTDDISALQYLYGANFHTNAGDTTYTWSATTGEMFIDGVGQGASSTNTIYEALWDGNGTDTYDLSNYTTDLTIDLRPGEWSLFSQDQLAKVSIFDSTIHPPGNLANANLYNDDPRSLIENAIGGSGNDTITGNIANNVLTGKGGDDTFTTGSGKDTVSGGSGDDVIKVGSKLTAGDKIDGGSGTDEVILNGKYSGSDKVVFKSGTIDHVEVIALLNGHNYNLTTASATVTSGSTLTVDATALTASHYVIFDGAKETNGHFIFKSGNGADTFTGGALSDTFVYSTATQSHGDHFDTIIAANFSNDKFDVSGTISDVDPTFTGGKLSLSTFDANLHDRMSGVLGANHAVLYVAGTGSLAGETFLVIDQNGVAGYQAGKDLVIHIDGMTGSLGTGDFI